MLESVKNYMTAMPHSINPEASVEKAQEMMREFNCHHLPVLEGGKLVGMMSDRDLRLLRKDDDTKSLKVGDFMMPDPISVEATCSMKEAIQTMVEYNINSLIIRAEGENPWGIFTSTNALQYCAKHID